MAVTELLRVAAAQSWSWASPRMLPENAMMLCPRLPLRLPLILASAATERRGMSGHISMIPQHSGRNERQKSTGECTLRQTTCKSQLQVQSYRAV